jgi:MYXO-CTERM domain-containing protein
MGNGTLSKLLALGILATLSLSARASAQCMQPNGEAIPSLPGCDGGRTTGLLATFACVCDEPGVCNIGAVCDPGLPDPYCPDTGMNAMCESRMWHSPNDNTCIPQNSDGLDPRADCSLEPQAFSPTCPLTFTVITRGTAIFENAFGWYNATGSPPAPSDLHVMLDCDDAPDTQVVLDLLNDPDYLGGDIGFFLVTPEDRVSRGTCADGNCCASVARYQSGDGYIYFSERAHNPEGDDYVHLLVYDSQVWERKFYFAWEDTFAAPNNDFTDLVTSVEGVECAGAGEPCPTGELGACGLGVTRCEGGALSCVRISDPESEVCNGVDDDCDDMVDDGATCGPLDVCHDGRCVPNCEISQEFICALGFECDGDSGHCVEIACRGVPCDEGEICRDGVCAGECEGVVCPRGQICFRDRCVDPCAGVACDAGQVCRGGICVPGCNQCNGIVCGEGSMCAAAGQECVDPSCPSGCPTGTFCREGSCIDACEGAVCPRGQGCTMGECVVPEEGTPDAGVGSGRDAGRVDGGARRDGGSGLIEADAGPRLGEDSGCACRAGARPSGAPSAVFLIALLAVLRRRRSTRSSV